VWTAHVQMRIYEVIHHWFIYKEKEGRNIRKYINNIIVTAVPVERRGRDRMIVGFTTTCAISAYHHWCCELESRSGRSAQHYVIKFVQ
jgi:hypothetical protein